MSWNNCAMSMYGFMNKYEMYAFVGCNVGRTIICDVMRDFESMVEE